MVNLQVLRLQKCKRTKWIGGWQKKNPETWFRIFLSVNCIFLKTMPERLFRQSLKE